MRESCEQNMLKLAELMSDFGIDVVVAVPKKIDPPAADPINISVALKIIKIDPFARFYGNGREALVVVHLRARVPNVAQIFAR